MSKEIIDRTQRIQQMFQDIQGKVLKNPLLDQLLDQLNAEAPIYRSIGFESASMGIAFQEIQQPRGLAQWPAFAAATGKEHVFHLDIGLGWALGKAGIHPGHPQWPEIAAIRPLLLDGMGYYFALYHGRRTLKQGWIPYSMSPYEQESFDSGIGRRLWYVCQGKIDQLAELLDAFPFERKAGLWRGLGIASGYVGGTTESMRKELMALAGAHVIFLQQGMKLAGICRLLSGTFGEDISLACSHISQLSQQDLQTILNGLSVDWFDRRADLDIWQILLTTENDLTIE